MLSSVKKILRITSDDFDGEIQELIDAAREDLMLSGVKSDKANDDTDPLIRRAIILYTKCFFGYDENDYERLLRAYDMLKQHLTLTVDYTIETSGS